MQSRGGHIGGYSNNNSGGGGISYGGGGGRGGMPFRGSFRGHMSYQARGGFNLTQRSFFKHNPQWEGYFADSNDTHFTFAII